MNPKYEKFCVEYIRNGRNATAAYKAAGYTKNGEAAKACASRLLTNANVQKRLKELEKEFKKQMEEEKKAAIMDVAEADEIVTMIARNKEAKDTDRLKATELYYKRHGLLVNKNQVSGTDGGAIILGWESDDES